MEVVTIKVTGVTKVMVAGTKAMVGTVAAAGTAGEIVTAVMMTDGVTVAETDIEVISLKVIFLSKNNLLFENLNFKF